MAEYGEDVNENYQLQEDIASYNGGGFIKLFRKFSEWEWYTDSQSVHLFVHILLHANHKTKNWQGTTVHRGQMITSVNKISLATGISPKAVRLRLKKFEKSGEITTKGANKFTVISICKYTEYQELLAPQGQTKGKQRANKGQTKGDKQEGKEGKERKEVYSDNSDEQSGVSWRDGFNQDVIDFVESFQQHIRKEVGSKAPKPTESLFKSASDTVDKLIRLDGHTLVEIKTAMRWAVQDDFWQRNALSLASLRKKTDGLTKFQKILAASAEKPKTQTGYGNAVYQDYECI